MMSKILSLDFWGTIAVFNPAYSEARTQLFAEVLRLPADEAHARYQYVKRACDHQAEHFGTGVTPLVAIKRILEGAKAVSNPVSILYRLEKLVREHPPLLHPEISAYIFQLQRNHGWKVGVSSNTNFIRGALVEEIFRDEILWDFTVYSDEIGLSKPDPSFFHMTAKRAQEAAGTPIAIEDILHIGDNSVCDVRGAQKVGMQARLSKSPDETAAMLGTFIAAATR